MAPDSDTYVLIDGAPGHKEQRASPSAITDDDATATAASDMVAETLLWFRAQASDAQSTPTTWPGDAVERIRSRRAALPDGRLFFDELLTLCEVDPTLYPPASHDGLARLLEAIYSTSTFDSLKQASLVYYLLEDFDAFNNAADAPMDDSSDSPETISAKADAFAASSFILPHFKDLMYGYWLLDKGHYEGAVPFLTSPDFIPKIYRTLFQPSTDMQQPQRSPLDRSRLLLRFLRNSIQPSSSPKESAEYQEELEMQVRATCWVRGPTKAFGLVREIASTFEDDETCQAVRRRLISVVFLHCFGPPNAIAIKNLLSCFLDAEEEVAFETFVLSPPAQMTPTWSYIAADVLLVRFVNEGRYMDAVRLDRRLGPDVSQGHSGSVDNAERSRLMEKRKRLVSGAREILPEVQKELLRIEESMELSAGRVAGSEADVKEGSEEKKAGDLKMSWEHVPRLGDANAQPPASPIDTASKLTPLSASPALRRTGDRSPNTQAALLSAVVRASPSSKAATAAVASPRRGQEDAGSPSSQSTSGTVAPLPQSANAPMVGFLAKNSLAFGQASPLRDADEGTVDADGAMDEDVPEPAAANPEIASSSAPLSKPGYRLANAFGAVASASGEASAAIPQSPWRNAPPLSSTSPFSGQPKIPTGSFLGRPEVLRTGSSSSSSASPFRPANASPFAAATSASSRQSPISGSFRSVSPSVQGSQRLKGALALISKQGRRRQDMTQEVKMFDDDDDEEEEEDKDEDEDMDGDDTFMGRPSQSTRGGNVGAGKVQVGRLVHGQRRQAETDDNELEAALLRDENQAATSSVKRASSQRSKASAPKSKNKSGDTGVVKSRSGRQTRSSAAHNQKPLTLSNLAANDEQHSESGVGVKGGDARPIARRTRAATAELESQSQQGDDQASQAPTDDAIESIAEDASTAYSVSERGDIDDAEAEEGRDALASLPPAISVRKSKRSTTATAKSKTTSGGKKDTASAAKASTTREVRRSSRLSSVESDVPAANQENQPPVKRSTKRLAGRTSKAAPVKVEALNDDTKAAGVRTRSGRRTMPGALAEE
ncbi:hypothetical protein ACQY0O_006748 [Thecaphora frezii]